MYRCLLAPRQNEGTRRNASAGVSPLKSEQWSENANSSVFFLFSCAEAEGLTKIPIDDNVVVSEI